MVFYAELKYFFKQMTMMNNLVYFTSMKSIGRLEGDDGEVEGRGRRGVTVGKDNSPLIEEDSLFLGM